MAACPNHPQRKVEADLAATQALLGISERIGGLV